MILVDSVFINNGGGKVLLDYLVHVFENRNLEVYYLFDKRCKGFYLNIPEERKCFIGASLFARIKFYKANQYKFSKILCFGNIPPLFSINAKVFTYFHQPLYLNISEEYSFFEKIKFKLKVLVIKFSLKNSDYWFVQSNLLKSNLVKKFGMPDEEVFVLPFFPQYSEVIAEKREIKSYLYVSNASPHKNHYRLISAFCSFYDKHKYGKLILTVSEKYKSIYKFIVEKQNLGFPIINIGFVSREELRKQYLASEFLIFPSLAESFGLGLIEGIQCGCKVIGADLPYTYEVCSPTLVFDPMDEESLFLAFENSGKGNLKDSSPEIYDRINDLLTFFE
jgi:glycosyltransferase involved in cell wall biosynthesis